MSAASETTNPRTAIIEVTQQAHQQDVRQWSRQTLAGVREAVHRLVVRSWRHTPPLVKRAAVRLAIPKVTLGVCAVIHDPAGRVLLARHTYRPQPWDLPGGFMRSHEQPAEALTRELREELGVQALIGPLLASSMTGSHLTLYYQVMMTGKPDADGVEIDGWRFVDLAEIPVLMGATPDWLTWVNPPRIMPAWRKGEQTTAGD